MYMQLKFFKVFKTLAQNMRHFEKTQGRSRPDLQYYIFIFCKTRLGVQTSLKSGKEPNIPLPMQRAELHVS